MKLAPIRNPHAKATKVEKKTKQEEKDDLIEKTKQGVLDRYGNKKGINKKMMAAAAAGMSGTGDKFQDKEDFKLEEKVTKKSQSIKLMKEGHLQSFIDFFYLTHDTTPSVITPNPQLLEDIKLNK